MRITANQLDQWARTMAAQQQLSRLVRRLVHGSVKASFVDIPAGDSVTRPGWDGQIVCEVGSAWVPTGQSFWEMSCRADTVSKAIEDYEKRTTNTAAANRSKAAFIFATALKWPGKGRWAAAKRADGAWADVRAYDADNFEQWLEQTPAVALQFSEELGLTGPGIESLGQYWLAWSSQTREAITPAAILTGRNDADAALTKRLNSSTQETSGPITIQADSVEEAVAFACANILGNDDLLNRTVVVTSPDGWQFVDANPSIEVAIAARPENAERPSKRAGVKVVIPFAAGDVTGHFSGAASLDDRAEFALERPDSSAFEKALVAIGIDESEATRLAHATGRSWSVFVRQRSRNPALHSPHWLSSPHAGALATVCLVGGWSTENKVDKTIVADVAGRAYEEVERDLAVLSSVGDAPVTRIGPVWKAKSPIELLALFGPRLTSSEIERFFDVLHSILATPDPELELHEDKRHAAQIYGKTRAQSGLLLRSLSDTLTRLAVLGSEITALRHLNLDGRATALVRNVLGDADGNRWLSLQSFLQSLAEAAPNEFLTAVESSLAKPDQPVAALLRETGSSGIFGRCYHASLLWALELLAWAPQRLVRVTLILARLSRIEIKGNWANTPQQSLLGIFRSWLPQTSAPIKVRLAALDRLVSAEADVAFEILDDIVYMHHDTATPSARPHWRNDDAGAGRAVPAIERHQMRVGATEHMFRLADGNASRLARLVEKIPVLDTGYVERVLNLCRQVTAADHSARAAIRTAIRKHIHGTRNYREMSEEELESHLRPIEVLYDEITPTASVQKYAWLFEDDWPDLPCRVRDDDFQERTQLIERLRLEAVREIYRDGGLPGIAEVAHVSNGYHVGAAMAGLDLSVSELAGWIESMECDFSLAHPISRTLTGLLRSLSEPRGTALMREIGTKGIATGWSSEKLAHFFGLAPERHTTWVSVLEFGADVDAAYWSLTNPGVWLRQEDPDHEFALKRLLEAKRPRTALNMCRYEIEKVDPLLLADILEQLLAGEEDDGRRVESWNIAKAVNCLEHCDTIDRQRLLRIEFGLIPALGYGEEHTAKALYKALMSDPQLFVELITLLYKPENRNVERESTEQQKILAEIAWRVLHACQLQPGTRPDGTIDDAVFTKFIDDVRRLCGEADRSTMCDQCLGEIMAHAPTDGDGTWPCKPVRDVLDHPEHEEMRKGFRVSVFNKRGVTSRGSNEGGNQERELAALYRRHSEAIQNSHVLLAATLETIALSYERDGIREDAAARLRREGR
jgi:hypothetical protein